MEETLFSLQQYKMAKQKDETLQKIRQGRLDRYKSDFNLFQAFCHEHLLSMDFNTLELYLHELITQQQVRLSTFNRRLAGVKYWLTNEYGLQFTSEHEVSVKLLRSLYDQEEYLRLKPMRGKRAEKQSDVLRLIDRYDTDKKSDIRKRAICLVNLITANRPSEMMRLKVSDFDLEIRMVRSCL